MRLMTFKLGDFNFVMIINHLVLFALALLPSYTTAEIIIVIFGTLIFNILLINCEIFLFFEFYWNKIIIGKEIYNYNGSKYSRFVDGGKKNVLFIQSAPDKIAYSEPYVKDMFLRNLNINDNTMLAAGAFCINVVLSILVYSCLRNIFCKNICEDEVVNINLERFMMILILIEMLVVSLSSWFVLTGLRKEINNSETKCFVLEDKSVKTYDDVCFTDITIQWSVESAFKQKMIYNYFTYYTYLQYNHSLSIVNSVSIKNIDPLILQKLLNNEIKFTIIDDGNYLTVSGFIWLCLYKLQNNKITTEKKYYNPFVITSADKCSKGEGYIINFKSLSQKICEYLFDDDFKEFHDLLLDFLKICNTLKEEKDENKKCLDAQRLAKITNIVPQDTCKIKSFIEKRDNHDNFKIILKPIYTNAE